MQELKPLPDNDKDYEVIERKLKELFRREIYIPLVKLLGIPVKTLQNSKEGLLLAIKSGRIQFNRGSFSGRFNASISRELKALGARWDRKTGTWKIPQSSLSHEVRSAISQSEAFFDQKLQNIDRFLAKKLPEEIADQVKLADHFERTLWKVEGQVIGSYKNLVLAPQLTEKQVKELSDDYTKNMKLWITDFTKENIEKLRKDMQASVFAGNRRDTAQKMIQSSYGTSVNKAKFLARQETRLLVTKFKQTRYEDAGVKQYRWGISHNPIQAKGAPYRKGNVRHDHGVLAGKIFSWDDPPVTDQSTGARNHPGQDFNCRCFAIPIVKF